MALSKKFFPLEYYSQPINEGYQLLPFRFHRMKKGDYLITNMVGEHKIVNQELLTRLVEGSVSIEDSEYNDLKAKHILMDQDSNVAIDLLSLKYRTKQYSISQFTALHIFVVSLRCDYTCKYCQVSRRMEGDNSFDMSENTALLALDLVFKSPSKAIKIEFQGGEPLLNFPVIKFIVKEALNINKTEERNLQFVITSNLTYLNEEVLEFCERHHIYISTSLDGPEELHNKNRPRPDKDGDQKTVDGIRIIQDYLGRDRVSALMTTTSESLKTPCEIIDEYVRLDLHAVFLRPLSPYGFALKTKQMQKYNIDNWLQFYKEGLEYILDLNKSGYFLIEQYTLIILKKILTPSNPGYVDLQSPSGAGITAIVYNYDGDVYASDEARMLKEMGDDKFRLGSVHNNTYEEILLSDQLLDALEDSLTESVPMCTDCGLQTYCGSDPVYHYATQGDVVGKKPLSFFCKKNTSIIEHVFKLLEDPENKNILEGWIK